MVCLILCYHSLGFVWKDVSKNRISHSYVMNCGGGGGSVEFSHTSTDVTEVCAKFPVIGY